MIIGITGLFTGNDPVAGWGVARCLRALGPCSDHRLVGLVYGPLESGLYEKGLLDKAFQIPFPGQDPAGCAGRLRQIKDGCGLDALIANLDTELPFFAEKAPALEQWGIKTLLPDKNVLESVGKDKLAGLAHAKLGGLALPRTTVVTRGELRRLKKVALPCMVKSPLRGARRVSSADELHFRVKALLDEGNEAAVIQQIVEGEEFSVGALAAKTGDTLGLVMLKKMLTATNGTTWMGICVEDAVLDRHVRDLIGQLGWKGPIDVEVIHCDKDGRYYLIEINPRFPGWISFCAQVGVNLPAMLIDSLEGHTVRAASAAAGEVFVRRAVDIVTDINTFGMMALTGEMDYE